MCVCGKVFPMIQMLNSVRFSNIYMGGERLNSYRAGKKRQEKPPADKIR